MKKVFKSILIKINSVITRKVTRELDGVTMTELTKFVDHLYKNYYFSIYKTNNNTNVEGSVYEVLNDYLKTRI